MLGRWKVRVRGGSMIIVRRNGHEFSVTVRKLTNQGREVAAVVAGHPQIDGETISSKNWVRLVQR